MRRSSLYGAGIVIVILALLTTVGIAVNGNLKDPTATFLGGKLEPASASFLMGTDHLGRDVFSRLVYATGLTLGWTFMAVLIALLIGSLLGMLAGYKVFPLLSPLLLFIGQISIVFPMRWLPLLIVALYGNGWKALLISMVFSMWGQFFWMIYDETKGLAGRSFLKASYMLGATKWQAIRMHLVPHLIPTILVLSVVKFRAGVGLISTLSFLGIGIRPPTPTWGIMIAEGHPYLLQAWWMTFYPTMALAISIIGVSEIGQRLERKWKQPGPLYSQREGSASAMW
jgi:peptide/nickel transport system permease protein